MEGADGWRGVDAVVSAGGAGPAGSGRVDLDFVGGKRAPTVPLSVPKCGRVAIESIFRRPVVRSFTNQFLTINIPKSPLCLGDNR